MATAINRLTDALLVIADKVRAAARGARPVLSGNDATTVAKAASLLDRHARIKAQRARRQRHAQSKRLAARG